MCNPHCAKSMLKVFVFSLDPNILAFVQICQAFEEFSVGIFHGWVLVGQIFKQHLFCRRLSLDQITKQIH